MDFIISRHKSLILTGLIAFMFAPFGVLAESLTSTYANPCVGNPHPVEIQAVEFDFDSAIPTMTIHGNNLSAPSGPGTVVTLGPGIAVLLVLASSPNFLVVDLTGIPDGDYRLSVSTGRCGDLFDLTIGATGPRGLHGPKGPPGPPGPPGPADPEVALSLCSLYILTNNPLPAFCPPCVFLDVAGFQHQASSDGRYVRTGEVFNGQPVWQMGARKMKYGSVETGYWEIIGNAPGRPAKCTSAANPGNGPFDCSPWSEWGGSGPGWVFPSHPVIMTCSN
jgi:hypothetical protein